MNYFEIILDALIKKGYSEEEAGLIIAEFIDENRKIDEIADRLHGLYFSKMNSLEYLS